MDFKEEWITDYKRGKAGFEKRAETLLEIAEDNAKKKKEIRIRDGIIFMLILIIVYLSVRSNIKIIHTETDKSTGAVLNTEVLTKSSSQAGEKETSYFIKKFIIDVRTIPSDTIYYDNKLKEISFFLTQNSQKKLDAMIEEAGVVQMLASKTTTNVDIISANKLTNTSNTYQVRWREKQFSEIGEEILNNTYLGVFTVDYVNQKNEEFGLKNPFGIIIKDFTISKENN